MLSAFYILLGLSVFVLIIWIRLIARRLNETADAMEGGKSVLVDRREWWSEWVGLGRVQAAGNRLVAENRERTASERSYLDQIRTTLGSIREAVLIVDDDNYIVLTNDAVQGLLGCVDAPLGRRLESVVQGPDFYDFVRKVKSEAGGEFSVAEVTIGRQSFWFEVSGARLPRQPGSEGVLTLFVLHDITRQKRLERVRTEFVANVSHELRTPLTIIKGFVDTLVEEPDDISPEEQQRFMLKIQRNVERLHELVEDLLMLSKLESEPNTIRRERISLGRIVTEVVENNQKRMQDAGKRFELELAEGNDVLLLDPSRISQVVENLIENVFRHAKDFRSVDVTTRIEDDAVSCIIRDDGVGIPPKDLKHIFERFYRVDKGRSRESGGTGLGLSIVKHIIQLHGGDVFAESSAGQGASIGFRIPYPEKVLEQAVLSFSRDQAGSSVSPFRRSTAASDSPSASEDDRN